MPSFEKVLIVGPNWLKEQKMLIKNEQTKIIFNKKYKFKKLIKMSNKKFNKMFPNYPPPHHPPPQKKKSPKSIPKNPPTKNSGTKKQ